MSHQFAVIFDMDGVLVDSYQAHFQSWRQLAQEDGLEMTEQQFASTFGRTSREIIAQVWCSSSFTDEAIEEMDRRKETIYRGMIARNFPVMEGATDLIRTLDSAGFALAVGSSGPAENVDLALDQLGLRDHFDVVVSGADVTRGKPDPQVFLLAAERLNLAHEQCAVIEDSPYGIAAANMAGMVSIGLEGPGRQPLVHADLSVGTLRALSAERIAALIARKTAGHNAAPPH